MAQRPDAFVGVRRGTIGMHGNGKATKVAGEQMRATIFEFWVAKHPNVW